jgi:hypothetical protein
MPERDSDEVARHFPRALCARGDARDFCNQCHYSARRGRQPAGSERCLAPNGRSVRVSCAWACGRASPTSGRSDHPSAPLPPPRHGYGAHGQLAAGFHPARHQATNRSCQIGAARRQRQRNSAHQMRRPCRVPRYRPNARPRPRPHATQLQRKVRYRGARSLVPRLDARRSSPSCRCPRAIVPRSDDNVSRYVLRRLLRTKLHPPRTIHGACRPDPFLLGTFLNGVRPHQFARAGQQPVLLRA